MNSAGKESEQQIPEIRFQKIQNPYGNMLLGWSRHPLLPRGNARVKLSAVMTAQDQYAEMFGVNPETVSRILGDQFIVQAMAFDRRQFGRGRPAQVLQADHVLFLGLLSYEFERIKQERVVRNTTRNILDQSCRNLAPILADDVLGTMLPAISEVAPSPPSPSALKSSVTSDPHVDYKVWVGESGILPEEEKERNPMTLVDLEERTNRLHELIGYTSFNVDSTGFTLGEIEILYEIVQNLSPKNISEGEAQRKKDIFFNMLTYENMLIAAGIVLERIRKSKRDPKPTLGILYTAAKKIRQDVRAGKIIISG